MLQGCPVDRKPQAGFRSQLLQMPAKLTSLSIATSRAGRWAGRSELQPGITLFIFCCTCLASTLLVRECTRQERHPELHQINPTDLRGSTFNTRSGQSVRQACEQVAVASTDFDPLQTETATILAAEGTSLTLDRPLIYSHFAPSVATGYKNISMPMVRACPSGSQRIGSEC